MSIFNNVNTAKAPARPAASNAGAGTRAERVQSKVWMNFGYTVTSQDEEGNEIETFIKLPYGVPIDTMEPSDTNANTPLYAQRMAAGNHLLKQVQAEAEKLAPGESKVILGDANGLQVQLRRVADAVAAPKDGENIFIVNAPFGDSAAA